MRICQSMDVTISFSSSVDKKAFTNVFKLTGLDFLILNVSVRCVEFKCFMNFGSLNNFNTFLHVFDSYASLT